jgi:ribosomal-protein-alanine N-acetyltransferase
VIEIRGERVLLRPFRPEEFEAVWQLRLASSSAVGTPSREGLRERLAHSGAWHEDRLDLAVELDGELVGEVDVRAGRRMMPPGVCELGIELWPERRGAGLGTDTIRTLTAWLHANGYPRVQGGTDVRNAAMRRVFAKAGYAEEGVMRSFMPDEAGRADFVLVAHVG